MNAAIPVRRVSAGERDRVVTADLDRCGIAVVRDMFPSERVAELRSMVDSALAADEVATPNDRALDVGRVIFPPVHDRRFLDLLDDRGIIAPCEAVLGPACHIYMMTTLCQPPGFPGRSVHVDTPFDTPGYYVGLGVMILLDDFTPESGPTRMDPAATVERPTEREYLRRALRLEAPAGSVCWYHPRLWHDALPNTTDRWRRSIAIGLVRPWVRQRFDMVRMLRHHDIATFSPGIRQKLGLDALPPGSYEEYFLPPEIQRDELLARAIRRP